jgi:hypothetical protein
MFVFEFGILLRKCFWKLYKGIGSGNEVQDGIFANSINTTGIRKSFLLGGPIPMIGCKSNKVKS